LISNSPSVSGVVLAGGRSTRMGQDKASLVLDVEDGRTLLQRVVDALGDVADEIVVVAAPGQALPAVTSSHSVVVTYDAVEGEGPLFGMATGLAAASAPVVLVMGVDHPFLQPGLLRLLVEQVRAGHRWVLPIAERRPQPLCSAFNRDALAVIRAHLAAGDRAPMAVAADLGMLRLPPEVWEAADPQGLSFVDVDTPEEFEAARARLERG
jgi:molybdenum cofactor guanylyltransferase